MCRGCACVYRDYTNSLFEFELSQSAPKGRTKHCLVGHEHLQPLWCLEHQIVYCTLYMMGWIGSNAGFQQQFEQQIQSGGRTVSTAPSGIQTKELHSRINQETSPHINIVPVHTNTEAHKMGNGSHCSQTMQKVSTPHTLLIRKIKITYHDKERTRKNNSKNSTPQYTSIKIWYLDQEHHKWRTTAKNIDGKNS